MKVLVRQRDLSDDYLRFGSTPSYAGAAIATSSPVTKEIRREGR